MKLKIFSAFAITFCILFYTTGSFGAENKTLKSPSVFIPESRYTFAQVVDGTEITHDFIVQNKGADLLKIEKVRTG